MLAVLGPGFALVVNPRRRDDGMAEPLLHLGTIGMMIERVGRSSSPERMCANL